MKNIYFSIITAIIFFSSCHDLSYEDAPMNNLANYENIIFKDYNQLPSGTYPAVNSHFTPKFSAKNFLTTWLNNNYFSMDVGSTASVIYDFVDKDRADSLNLLSQTFREIGPMDYKNVWGTPFVESFTPSKSFESEIPNILSEVPDTSNPYRVVRYKNSENEPKFEYNKEVFYINQNFNYLSGATWGVEPLPPGYFSKEMTGKGRNWMTYVINANAGNRGLFAYCNYQLGGDAWFITESIDLTAAVNPLFTFDLGTGYYFGIDCLKVYISETFNGTNPTLDSWEDISDELGVKENPTVTGYPGLHALKTINLSKYSGRKVYIAVRYDLPVKESTYSQAPLYIIDNLKMYETRDYATIDNAEEKFDIFKFNNGKWELMNDIYILQANDYASLEVDEINVEDSEQYISQLLKNKLTEYNQDNIVVVYKNSHNTTYAENFVLIDGEWVKEPLPPVMQKKDNFKYTSNTEKWTFVSSEDL